MTKIIRDLFAINWRGDTLQGLALSTLYQQEIQVATHPTGDAVGDISDHVMPRAKIFQVQLAISDYPLIYLPDGKASLSFDLPKLQRAPGPPLVVTPPQAVPRSLIGAITRLASRSPVFSVSIPTTSPLQSFESVSVVGWSGTDYQRGWLAYMETLADSREQVQIVAGLRTYDQMQLKSYKAAEASGQGYAVFDLSFEQIRIGTTSTELIPKVSTPAAAKKKKVEGAGVSEVPPDTGGSMLYNIFGR